MKKSIFLYSAWLLLLTSCIKEKNAIDFTDNTKRLITEFTEGKNEINTLAVDYSEQFVEVDLAELQIYRSDLNSDVQVKIAINDELITNYNLQHQASLSPLPAGSFSIVSQDLVISPAKRKVKVRLKIKSSEITGGAYAIGLSIAQVSKGEISSIYKDVLTEVLVKNSYEGSYTADGLRTAYSGTTNTSPVAAEYTVEGSVYAYTVDQNTVDVQVADLAGSWMYLQVDPNTNAVTVLPSSSDTFDSLENNGPCTYDPATKTFTLNYKYFNANGLLREIHQTLVAE